MVKLISLIRIGRGSGRAAISATPLYFNENILYLGNERILKNHRFAANHNLGCILYLEKCFSKSDLGSICISSLKGEYLLNTRIYQFHPRPIIKSLEGGDDTRLKETAILIMLLGDYFFSLSLLR